jgi:rhomboid protease GluP
MRGWEMLSPSNRALFIMGASGAAPVFGYGRWWTVLSAAWLHGGLLHIAFNLLWVRQLAPAVSELYGPSRSVILYTFASITGFLLSSLAGLLLWNSPIPFLRGAMLTIGASAPIFGLLGALVVYGRRTGNSHISGQAMTYAIVIFVFGFILPGIDNFAHLGGFLGGYAGALLLNPLRSERTDHLIGAIICLVLTVLSVLISVVTAPQI